jgi:predicted RNase H-like HicB family nuclease
MRDMLTDYIEAALASARFSRIENGAYSHYAEIPAIRGAWATGRDDREAREELRRSLEALLFHALSEGEDLPEFGGHAPVLSDAAQLPSRYAGTDLTGLNGREEVTEYIDAALKGARFEPIEDTGTVFAEAPGVPGAWAEGRTEAEARRLLGEVIEDWILTRTRLHLEVPALGGTSLSKKIPA